jgi:formylglycine-generating enzyme required for sulfatase activity
MTSRLAPILTLGLSLLAPALSGKRLLTTEEWQRAAAGTPDPGPLGGGDPEGCNHYFDWPPYPAGARAHCVSSWGAFDMVGNFGEWTADVANAWDFTASQQPPQHALILGIAGARSIEPRYFADEASDGIGFRCGR